MEKKFWLKLIQDELKDIKLRLEAIVVIISLKDKIKWQKIGELEWSENLGKMDWYKGCEKCKKLVGAVLPERKDLIDLVDNHREEIRDWDIRQYFWSSTEYYSDATYAWYTNLHYGSTDDALKANAYYVRCVRR